MLELKAHLPVGVVLESEVKQTWYSKAHINDSSDEEHVLSMDVPTHVGEGVEHASEDRVDPELSICLFADYSWYYL
jgi:hypothetical protein